MMAPPRYIRNIRRRARCRALKWILMAAAGLWLAWILIAWAYGQFLGAG